jgi:hypothetical protein
VLFSPLLDSDLGRFVLRVLRAIIYETYLIDAAWEGKVKNTLTSATLLPKVARGNDILACTRLDGDSHGMNLEEASFILLPSAFLALHDGVPRSSGKSRKAQSSENSFSTCIF